MILGILSDSHGQSLRTARAVRLLGQLGATALAHCGDIGGEGVLSALTIRPTRFVWGNTDFPDATLIHFAESLGLPVPGDPPVRWQLADKQIAIFHGHEPAFDGLLRAAARHNAATFAARIGDADYVLSGHTHRAADVSVGQTRLINPGALHRARTHTVATLDLDSGELVHWVVTDSDEPGPPQRYALDP